MPFRMPPIPFPMPPLFITAVKDICAINTFEKLLNILFSEVSCWHFGFTTPFSPFFTIDMSLYEVLTLFPHWPFVFRSFLLPPLVARDVITPMLNGKGDWWGGGLGREKGYIEPFSIQILELLYLKKCNSSRSTSVSILCAGENQRTYLVPFKK